MISPKRYLLLEFFTSMIFQRNQPQASPGGVLPMWWVIHMCRGFDPLFSLWQDRARSFWGTFSHPPTAKLSFGVQKLPIFTKIDLFVPKFNFFLDLFGSNFQRPAAHPHQFSGRVPPPGGKWIIWHRINFGNSQNLNYMSMWLVSRIMRMVSDRNRASGRYQPRGGGY